MNWQEKESGYSSLKAGLDALALPGQAVPDPHVLHKQVESKDMNLGFLSLGSGPLNHFPHVLLI